MAVPGTLTESAPQRRMAIAREEPSTELSEWTLSENDVFKRTPVRGNKSNLIPSGPSLELDFGD